jgi:hypothetical protein
MKALNWIAWISGGIGAIILLMGVIAGFFLHPPYFGHIDHAISIFTFANRFFLITIALFVYLYRCQCKKE